MNPALMLHFLQYNFYSNVDLNRNNILALLKCFADILRKNRFEVRFMSASTDIDHQCKDL